MTSENVIHSHYPVHPEVLQPGQKNLYFSDCAQPTREDMTDGCAIKLIDDERYICAAHHRFVQADSE